MHYRFIGFFTAFLTLSGSGFSQSCITANNPGVITTFTNAFTAGVSTFADGAPATTQAIGFVRSVARAQDGRGGFYFAAPEDNRIYRVLGNGQIFLVMGTRGASCRDATAPARDGLGGPIALATDRLGNLYISDSGNRRVLKVLPNGSSTIVTTDVSNARGLALDPSNNLYVADISRRQILRVLPTGLTEVVAGNGNSGAGGDGGPALAASFGIIDDIAADGSGNIYVSDTQNNRVRKFAPGGRISTFAGTGVAGYSGDGGAAAAAQMNHPQGLTFDPAGNLYIADYFNNVVRKVDTSTIITTVAGVVPGGVSPSSPLGTGGFAGDGGPATSGQLKNPIALAVDDAGNLEIADTNNFRIRKVDAQGMISTAAGNGKAGKSDFEPRYLAADKAGNIYLVGVTGGLVQKVTPAGTLVTVAGNGTWGLANDGGPATQAQTQGANNLALDAAGNIYFTELARVRKVSANGIINTIAGTGTMGFTGDGGPAKYAAVSNPSAIAVDASGNIFFYDTNNYRIREITLDGNIRTVAGNGLSSFQVTGPTDGPALSVYVSAADLKFDPSGNLLFTGNGHIKKLANGIITNVADLSAGGLALDKQGNIYASETNSQRIRKIFAGGPVTTIVGSGGVGSGGDGGFPTIAGTGAYGYSGDGGPATSAQFYAPTGLAIDGAGTLFIADSFNSAIRKLPLLPSASFTVSNLDAVSSTTTGVAPDASSGFASLVGYSGNDATSAFEIIDVRNNNALVSEASIVATPAIRSGRIQAQISGRTDTGLAIANPNDEAASVSFYFTEENGDFNHGTLSIPANSHMSAFLTEPAFNRNGPMSGSFTFVSSVPVAVTALRTFLNERSEFLITTLPVVNLDAPPAVDTLTIPQLASGDGWTTEIALVNPTDAAISGSVELRTSSGLPAERIAYVVPARGAQIVQSPGWQNSTVTIGNADVVPANSSVTPSAIAIFSYRRNGITVTMSGVPALPSATGYRLYRETSGDFSSAASGSIETGVAIANPSGAAADVTLTDGSRTAVLTVPAKGQIALFLNEVPGFKTSGFQGVVQLQSPARVSLIGLRGRYNERGDFLIATIPPVNDSVSASADEVYFPHFVDSGGYQTQFIFLSGTTAQSTGSLRLFSDSSAVVKLNPQNP